MQIGKDSAGNILFFLIYHILEIEIVHFMVEDNYHQWEVNSNSKVHLGLVEVDVKLCSCVRLSGVGEESYIFLSGKDSAGNNIFFFLI